MQKWGRVYKINIKTPDSELITIEPPFSVHFDIEKNVQSSVNTIKVKIYNLAPKTRNKIYKDRYDTTSYWQIQVYGGYGESLFLLGQGNIIVSSSSKQGTEWITEIEAYDGMYAIQNSFSSMTIAKGGTLKQNIAKFINDMPGITKGNTGTTINNNTETSKRGMSYSGNSYEAIKDLTGGNCQIDNETLHCIDQDDYIGDYTFSINSGDLLETPKRNDTLINIKILFEPQIFINNLVTLESKETVFNGTYKVLGISHSVDILGNSSGTATTEAKLYAGAAALTKVTS